MKVRGFVSLAALSVVLMACSSEDPVKRSADEGWPELTMPIPGATFSMRARDLPGRRGEERELHRGFDLIHGFAGRPIDGDQPVVAVADGMVLEIVRSEQPQTPSTKAFLRERASGEGRDGDLARSAMLGTQVWLLHEGGLLSRYGHLGTVDERIVVGMPVRRGEPIGTVGRVSPAPGEAPRPGVHFELQRAEGAEFPETTGAILETHRLAAQLFGDEALPRFARSAISVARTGKAAAQPYPPDPMPEARFRVDPPASIVAGDAVAVSIQWQQSRDDFTPASFHARLNERPLPVWPAPNGAWILIPAPRELSGQFTTLAIHGVDRFGRVLVGHAQVEVVEFDPAEPVSASAEMLALLGDEEARERESVFARRLLSSSRRFGPPVWTEPFQRPLEGTVLRAYGQPLKGPGGDPAFPSPGIDYRAEAGTDVRAVNAGVVGFADQLPIRGRTVVVLHGGGVASVYAHLGEFSVEPGQRVEPGTVLGSVGHADAAGASRLRLEFHTAGVTVDPESWFGSIVPVARNHGGA